MTATDADNCGFQMQQSRHKTSKKRIYIGNLPHSHDIKSKLVNHVNKQANLQIDETDVTMLRQGAALVACSDINRAISLLNNTEFEGLILVVQRERKKRPENNKKKQAFGGGGWNRPSSENKPLDAHRPASPPKETGMEETSLLVLENKDSLQLFDNELELSQHLASIVAKELKATEEDPSNGDVVNTVIASTAAMTLLSSTDAFGLDQDNSVVDESSPQRPSHPTEPGGKLGDDNGGDFLSRSQKPLSELLADYGEQDPDFQKVVPTTVPDETTTKERQREDYNNRLTLEGKAPIHVQVTSFGYIHGVPSEVRSGGWSHAHPLSPMDCRDLPQVPHYMGRQDGLSPHVKRALLNARDKDDDTKRDDSVRKCANELASKMFDALYEAIEAGGYGHASPLRMTIYVGSENGRHRSVVVCELAATALRKLLRSNKDNRITQPVSVGTRHRDIERRQQRKNGEQQSKANRRK